MKFYVDLSFEGLFKLYGKLCKDIDFIPDNKTKDIVMELLFQMNKMHRFIITSNKCSVSTFTNAIGICNFQPDGYKNWIVKDLFIVGLTRIVMDTEEEYDQELKNNMIKKRTNFYDCIVFIF